MIKIGVGSEYEAVILPYDLQRLIKTLMKQNYSGFDLNDSITIDFIHEYDLVTIMIIPENTYDEGYDKLYSILKEVQKQHNKEFKVEMM